MYIRTKVSLIQSLMAAAALAAVLGIMYRSVSSLVNEKDDAYYRQRLGGIVAQVRAEHANLERTGLADVEAYVAGAQKSLLEALAKVHGSPAPGEPYLFLADRTGRILLAPPGAVAADLAASVKGVAGEKDDEGSLRATVGGRATWIAWHRFEPWGWSLGYAVDEDFKYGALHRFLRLLVILSAVSLGAMLAVSYFGVRRAPAIGASQPPPSHRGRRSAGAVGSPEATRPAALAASTWRSAWPGSSRRCAAAPRPWPGPRPSSRPPHRACRRAPGSRRPRWRRPPARSRR
jgi:hypothetical protein